MGDLISRLRKEGPQIWRQLSLLQRATLIGVVLATVGAIVFLTQWSQQVEYATVFTNLNDTDAAAVVAKLKELKVPYELTNNGTTVRVPSDKVYDVRLQLVSQGLPKGGSVGFELFDKTNFGLTDFAQRLNFQRALEGELSRTLSKLTGVEEARVHLAIPQAELFVDKEKPVTASVALKLKPGGELDARQVKGVVNLMSRSVEGLKPENITIVDGDGVTLSGQDNDVAAGAGRSSTQQEAQRTYEKTLQRDLQTMLEQVLGSRKAVVKVSALFDWDQYEASSETYSPAGKPTQVRSSKEVSEKSALPLDSGVGGVPTYPLNPRSPAGPVSPQATPEATPDPATGVVPTPAAAPNTAAAAAVAPAEPKYERKEVTTNYEVSKLVEKTVKAPGSVKKLSVSVMLDGQVDDATSSTISKSVTAAAGLDSARGDSVVVASMPFDKASQEAQQKATEESAQRETYITVAKGAAIAISLLVVLLLVRSVIRGLTRDPEKEELIKRLKEPKVAKSKSKGKDLPEVHEVPRAALSAARNAPEPEDPRRVQVQHDVSELAKAQPKVVAQILKTWIDER